MPACGAGRDQPVGQDRTVRIERAGSNGQDRTGSGQRGWGSGGDKRLKIRQDLTKSRKNQEKNGKISKKYIADL